MTSVFRRATSRVYGLLERAAMQSPAGGHEHGEARSGGRPECKTKDVCLREAGRQQTHVELA